MLNPSPEDPVPGRSGQCRIPARRTPCPGGGGSAEFRAQEEWAVLNPVPGRSGQCRTPAPARGRQEERVARGEDVPPPHSQLGTVDFIYLFYSEIYQTWDWSLPEPGVRGRNPGPTHHLPKCNYQMR